MDRAIAVDGVFDTGILICAVMGWWSVNDAICVDDAIKCRIPSAELAVAPCVIWVGVETHP